MSRLDTMLQFLESDPDDSFTRYAVALEYMSMKEYRLARTYLIHVRDRDPSYLAVYYQLGHVCAALEEWDAAEDAYRAGIAAGRSAGDLHTVSELQSALDELETMR